MSISRISLADELAKMTPEEVTALRTEGRQRFEAKEEKKQRRALNDPHGTIRYDTENDMFLVRAADPRDIVEGCDPSWTAYLNEGHGCPLYDTDIKPTQCPVIGIVP